MVSEKRDPPPRPQPKIVEIVAFSQSSYHIEHVVGERLVQVSNQNESVGVPLELMQKFMEKVNKQ